MSKALSELLSFVNTDDLPIMSNVKVALFLNADQDIFKINDGKKFFNSLKSLSNGELPNLGDFIRELITVRIRRTKQTYPKQHGFYYRTIDKFDNRSSTLETIDGYETIEWISALTIVYGQLVLKDSNPFKTASLGRASQYHLELAENAWGEEAVKSLYQAWRMLGVNVEHFLIPFLKEPKWDEMDDYDVELEFANCKIFHGPRRNHKERPGRDLAIIVTRFFSYDVHYALESFDNVIRNHLPVKVEKAMFDHTAKAIFRHNGKLLVAADSTTHSVFSWIYRNVCIPVTETLARLSVKYSETYVRNTAQCIEDHNSYALVRMLNLNIAESLELRLTIPNYADIYGYSPHTMCFVPTCDVSDTSGIVLGELDDTVCQHTGIFIQLLFAMYGAGSFFKPEVKISEAYFNGGTLPEYLTDLGAYRKFTRRDSLAEFLIEGASKALPMLRTRPNHIPPEEYLAATHMFLISFVIKNQEHFPAEIVNDIYAHAIWLVYEHVLHFYGEMGFGNIRLYAWQKSVNRSKDFWVSNFRTDIHSIVPASIALFAYILQSLDEIEEAHGPLQEVSIRDRLQMYLKNSSRPMPEFMFFSQFYTLLCMKGY